MRGTRAIAGFAATMLVLTGCSSGKAGTALPHGNDAATYVSARFTSALEALSEDFKKLAPRKSELKGKFLANGEGINSSTSTVLLGDPPGELVRHHSLTDLNDYMDHIIPPQSEVQYALLGPDYQTLAPTPWVALPNDPLTYSACHTGTYITVCKMLNAAVESTKSNRAAKKATRQTDGSVTLELSITLDDFVRHRIEVFPKSVQNNFTDEMRKTELIGRITLTGDNRLIRYELGGKFAGKTKKGTDLALDISYDYQLTEGATATDIPQVPQPGQYTDYTSQAAADEFYRKRSEIKGQTE